MKRLKIKVFLTIFIILSTFSFMILFFSNVREYKREKNEIKKVLERSYNFLNEDEFKNVKPSINFEKREEIFINFKIYNFLLDDDGNIYGLINGFLDTDNNMSNNTSDAVAYAKKISSKSNIEDEEINIIFDKYSYSKNDNILTVIDNSHQTSTIRTYIIYSLVLFILIEIISLIITYYLTKWITKPVIDSFERERRFIGDASHELKTPIAVIMASTDAYSQDKNKKWLDNIKSESDRMNKLVTELLDLNSLENNSKKFTKENVNLSKLIESSLLPYESLFFENNLKFDYKIDKDIYFDVNEEKIKELISILIDNAIKYSCEKGKVNVSLYKNKDIYLTVSNKGEPIPIEERKKIFDRFYKLDKSRNRKSNNYGLGLSIAKKIVELHSGKISVDCAKGITTFIIKL